MRDAFIQGVSLTGDYILDFATEENTLRCAQSGRIRASKDGGGSAGRDTTWTHHVTECDADA